MINVYWKSVQDKLFENTPIEYGINLENYDYLKFTFKLHDNMI